MERTGGNSVLEMILFIPLGILLLTSGLDAGLGLTERAAVRDAVRSAAVSSSAMATGKQSAFIVSGHEVAHNEEFKSLLLDRVLEEYQRSLQSARVDLDHSNYSVYAALVNFKFNRETGAYENAEVIADSSIGDGVGENAFWAYLDNEVDLTLVPSPLSKPVGIIYRSDRSTQLRPDYMSDAVYIFTAVSGQAFSTNAPLFRFLVGHAFEVYEPSMFPVRRQLR